MLMKKTILFICIMILDKCKVRGYSSVNFMNTANLFGNKKLQIFFNVH